MHQQKHNFSSADSWEELGKAGEQKVLTAIPEGFFYVHNVLLPCQHGNDYEEIDLIVVGVTGIWSIEVKNWRGIAYPGDYPEELIFVRNSLDGRRTSYRDNPYRQARDHSQDLYYYLRSCLNEWFPTINTLIVFASRDPEGVNGANIDRVRPDNPSIIYIEEMSEVLTDPNKTVRAWDGQYRVQNALSKLRTWDVIQFTTGKRKRGILCYWPGLKITYGSKTTPIRWEDVRRVEIIHGKQSALSTRFIFLSGDMQVGELGDDKIPLKYIDGKVESIKLSEIVEIQTGYPCHT